MFGDRDPCHHLQPLGSTNVPKRLLFLDCRGWSIKQQGTWAERWRDGTLGTTHYTSRKGERRDTVTNWDDVQALWRHVDGFCVKGKRQVLWADDLASQIRLSGALIHLPAMGWRLRKIVLERTAAWALFTNDKRSLMLCDLRSWMPSGIASVTGQHNRIERLRDHVTQILAWIVREDLGPFRPTGSGQSYSAFRKRFLTHNLLVHDDMIRLDAERKAMWTGRCEAWKHGELRNGPYYEYDMHSAYCEIAADCDVPTYAMGELYKPTFDSVLDHGIKKHVLADVTVHTEMPCVPTGRDGKTLWPVGSFRTALWTPELELLADHGADVKVHRAFLYRKGPALQAFAQWVLGAGESDNTSYGPVIGAVLKHWSRCLVGRLGLRYRSWVTFGTSPVADLRLVTYIDSDEGTSTDMLCAGYDRMLLAAMAEASESLPQIPSYVMSVCRRRLWLAMCDLGLSNVVYVDTDSIITTVPECYWIGDRTNKEDSAVWHVKGIYDRLNIRGPRNLDLESTRRISGVPKTARQTAPLEFTGEVMRSIKESMRAGELDCVASIPRSFSMKSIDTRRKHLQNGTTMPFRTE
jgi:hypothetical protein